MGGQNFGHTKLHKLVQTHATYRYNRPVQAWDSYICNPHLFGLVCVIFMSEILAPLTSIIRLSIQLLPGKINIQRVIETDLEKITS